MNKRLSGQITILATLSLTIILSLIAALLKSATDVSINTRIKQACILASESCFSAYHNDCLDEFNVFVLENADRNQAKLSKYINENLSDMGKEVMLDGLQINEVEYATDNSGAGVYDEILSYMKYGVYADVVNKFKDSDEAVKQAEATKEITDKIEDVEEQLAKLDSYTLKLVTLVEGIKTTEDGLVIKGGKPQFSGSAYAKRGVYGPASMALAAVDNEKVYNVINSSDLAYIDLKSIIDDMYTCLDGLEEIGDEASNQNGNNSYANIFKRDYDKIKEYVTSTKEVSNKGIEAANGFSGEKDNSMTALNELDTKIQTNKDTLGDDLYNSFNDDYKEISKDGVSAQRKLCDIEKIKSGLSKNITYLNNAENNLNNISDTLTQDKIAQYRTALDSLKGNLSAISNSDLKFDYSAIDFSSSHQGLSKIKNIKSTIENGYLGMIIEDDSTISTKKISYTDLASDIKNEKLSSGISLKDAKDDVLYNEYLFMHFNSAASLIKDEKLQKQESGELDYVLEYILCGEKSDKENLSKTLFEMSVIREGANLAYLLTDSEKKSQARILSQTLLGFTGIEAVIIAGQYLILGVWAYAESIVDLKKLMKGGKVPLVKNDDSWVLTLDAMLNMDFKDDSNSDSGLAYDDYLRMLLLIADKSVKNMRTMGAMELKMIELGHANFRMKNYIVSFKGVAKFRKNETSNIYTQEISYSYRK